MPTPFSQATKQPFLPRTTRDPLPPPALPTPTWHLCPPPSRPHQQDDQTKTLGPDLFTLGFLEPYPSLAGCFYGPRFILLGWEIVTCFATVCQVQTTASDGLREVGKTFGPSRSPRDVQIGGGDRVRPVGLKKWTVWLSFLVPGVWPKISDSRVVDSLI